MAPDDPASTAVQWLLRGNLRRRLLFKEWDGFHDKVVDAHKVMAKLREEHPIRNRIERCLEMLREELKSPSWDQRWGEGDVKDLVSRDVWRAVNAARPHATKHLRISKYMEDVCFASERRVRTENVAQLLAGSKGTPAKVDAPSVVIPDVSLFTSFRDSVEGAVPLATIEIKGSCARPFHDMGDEHDVREIIRKYQHYFDMNPETHCKHKEFVVTKRVAQTLSQAVHTQSGCGVLYNHTFAVFFHIVGKKTMGEKGERVVVEVSRPYSCDGGPSNLDAFLAWTFMVEDCAAYHQGEREKKAIREGLMHSIQFLGRKPGADDDDEDDSPSTARPKSSSHTSTQHRGSSASGGRGKKDSKKDEKAEKKSGGGKSKKRAIGGPSAVGMSKKASSSLLPKYERFEDYLAHVDIEDAAEYVEKYRDDELIGEAMMSGIGLLGEGSYGVVRKARVRGREMAVKSWGGIDIGRDIAETRTIYHEIVVYCYIANVHPTLLGTSLPNLIAVGFDPWAGPVLVTEVVGDALSVDRGGLYMGEGENKKKILQKDIASLTSSAMECLKALHNCGITHCDAVYRNLRVALLGAKNGESEVDSARWKVWWVDLGISNIKASKVGLETEMHKCSTMFDDINVVT